MKKILVCALLLIPISSYATGLKCSVRPAKDTPESGLAAFAKISLPEAQKQALAHMASKHKTSSFEIASSELEIERGCLVYSFDIKVIGKLGVKEIFVDAGDAKILLYQHETPQQEAAEKAKG